MPVDPDTGEVDQSTVLQVLECHRVTATPDPDNPGQTIFSKGDKLDVREFPDWCGRDLLQYFQRTFGVPMFHFYHPEIARKMAEARKKRIDGS
jgi:hypothetical protein